MHNKRYEQSTECVNEGGAWSPARGSARWIQAMSTFRQRVDAIRGMRRPVPYLINGATLKELLPDLRRAVEQGKRVGDR